jgi:hypothetical protein
MLRGKKIKSELRLAQLVQEFEFKKKVVPAITRIALAKVTFSTTT